MQNNITVEETSAKIADQARRATPIVICFDPVQAIVEGYGYSDADDADRCEAEADAMFLALADALADAADRRGFTDVQAFRASSGSSTEHDRATSSSVLEEIGADSLWQDAHDGISPSDWQQDDADADADDAASA